MSRGDAPCTLVLGPLGLEPWITRAELLAQLHALDHRAVDNDVEHVVPAPDPVPPRVGRVAVSLPALAVWSARMMLRWRRATRRGLRDAGVNRVLVWDPVWAAFVRIARPRGVEVIWAWDGSNGDRLDQRLLHRWLRYSCDRWVAAAGFESAQWSARVFAA
ncbi:MAG: hypothetical protein Q8K63_06280 [Acidimicrobiales bacterium]|nr:hypothetical protein [Acidimicrobiales bacterium]